MTTCLHGKRFVASLDPTDMPANQPLRRVTATAKMFANAGGFKLGFPCSFRARPCERTAHGPPVLAMRLSSLMGSFAWLTPRPTPGSDTRIIRFRCALALQQRLKGLGTGKGQVPRRRVLCWTQKPSWCGRDGVQRARCSSDGWRVQVRVEDEDGAEVRREPSPAVRFGRPDPGRGDRAGSRTLRATPVQSPRPACERCETQSKVMINARRNHAFCVGRRGRYAACACPSTAASRP